MPVAMRARDPIDPVHRHRARVPRPAGAVRSSAAADRVVGAGGGIRWGGPWLRRRSSSLRRMCATAIAVLGLGSAGIPLIVFAVVVWLALVRWTYVDVGRRTRDPRAVWLATAISVIPVAGIVVYLILRPAEYLEDAYEREISIASSERLIAVLKELQDTQREIHTSVQRLEQALQAARRRASTQASRSGESS